MSQETVEGSITLYVNRFGVCVGVTVDRKELPGQRFNAPYHKSVPQRLSSLEVVLDALVKRIGALEDKWLILDNQMESVDDDLDTHNVRIRSLETRSSF